MRTLRAGIPLCKVSSRPHPFRSQVLEMGAVGRFGSQAGRRLVSENDVTIQAGYSSRPSLSSASGRVQQGIAKRLQIPGMARSQRLVRSPPKVVPS